MPSDLDTLLHAAVTAVGGTERPGQVQMANAVRDAVEDERHLLVQAGTGTGKSLAYLVPAIAHAFATGKPAVVATATLALQAQIVDRDLPRIADALRPVLGRRPTFALVKGRSNYLCQHKLVGGFPEEEDEGLLSVGAVDREASRLGKEVTRLREWAEITESGDRDELVPGVSARAWRQVSVSARECLGATKCPVASECFVELSRAAARDVDVVVTNHSFMAIDAFEGRQMLPDHDLLVIDEAHELTDRVTSTITDELTAATVAIAAKRAGKLADTTALTEAADTVQAVLDELPEGRLHGVPDRLSMVLAGVRDAARGLQTELKPESGADGDAGRQLARAAIGEVFDTAERLLEERELDVAWISKDPRRGSVLRVAPMSVAMLLRDKIFGERTVVMTSATLELGGTFDAVAGTLGLRGEGAPAWQGLDVGSPFDYPQQAIAYVASHLPPPGRDGTSEQVFDEIEGLVRAAGGRTLGLFSSRRAAEAAAEQLRDRLSDTGIRVLCQGDDQMPTLVREFASDASTCLFGTMSLWQGVDVPGSACQLVIIDRIPFPRPDDPLSSARSEAIGRMGGNGFMAVSATHAALKLAQGAGRLVRRGDDRGVVAFLDSRMMSARYAGFLQRSLPPFWPTADRALVLAALARLDETAADPLPVQQSGLRGVGGAPSAGTGTTGDAVDHVPGRAAADARPVADPPPVARSPRTAVTGGHAWTAEQDDELRDGVEAGLTLEELADHLELAPDVVTARLNLLELELADPEDDPTLLPTDPAAGPTGG
ncbi:ATP-dependent DNA helicase [Ornithinicoccus hortensis]|uniref:ATP-dependent helicase DinG n=1 Tax=Ornithinicoccus hortensis TaxID=82346 RepID=A0A542YQM8_9MICO|nr:ATP-dependent DNA helicase [Ornithinicoccus hortensis]TQL50379.1 ATP-dependent DNA helicase DinG [Ornithinicoccus hortensis]